MEGRTLTRAERLARIATGFVVLHHTDHVLRFDHSGWPFRPEVTPFTYSLLIYPLIAFMLAGRRHPWMRVVAALILFLFPTLAHLSVEPPSAKYGTWAYSPEVNLLHTASPALGILSVTIAVMLSVFALATVIGFVREARQVQRQP